MKEEYFILAQSTMKMVAQFANTIPSIARALDPNNSDENSVDIIAKFHLDLMMVQMTNAQGLSDVDPEVMAKHLTDSYKEMRDRQRSSKKQLS